MMLSKTVDTARALAEFLRGSAVTRGTDGAGTAVDATFTSATGAFVADGVAAGDVLYLDGEAEAVVASVTSATELEVTGAFAATFSSTHYRICRGKIDAEDIVYAGPDGGQNGKWIALWDSPTFSGA